MEQDIDISEINSKEELIEKINKKEIGSNIYLKINLVGNRKIQININDIFKFIENNNILKIKDKTKISYNIEKISGENNLKGIFVKRILEKIKEEPENKEELEKALEIGLSVLI